MQKRRALISGLLMLIIFEILISTTATGITIIIDADFSDWDGLEPVFTEEEIHPDYWLDIQQAFVAANETMMFVRVDYAAQLDYAAILMTNITLQTPSNEVFILMYGINYESVPHWSKTWIFPGINLSSYLNGNLTEIASYQSSAAISPSNTSVEYYYPLNDLNLTLNDTVNVTFWHYEAISAGEYIVPLHKKAGTVYQISLKQTVNESSGTSGSTSTSTTTTTNNGTTTTDSVIFGLDSIISLVILVPLIRKKRS